MERICSKLVIDILLVCKIYWNAPSPTYFCYVQKLGMLERLWRRGADVLFEVKFNCVSKRWIILSSHHFALWLFGDHAEKSKFWRGSKNFDTQIFSTIVINMHQATCCLKSEWDRAWTGHTAQSSWIDSTG